MLPINTLASLAFTIPTSIHILTRASSPSPLIASHFSSTFLSFHLGTNMQTSFVQPLQIIPNTVGGVVRKQEHERDRDQNQNHNHNRYIHHYPQYSPHTLVIFAGKKRGGNRKSGKNTPQVGGAAGNSGSESLSINTKGQQEQESSPANHFRMVDIDKSTNVQVPQSQQQNQIGQKPEPREATFDGERLLENPAFELPTFDPKSTKRKRRVAPGSTPEASSPPDAAMVDVSPDSFVAFSNRIEGRRKSKAVDLSDGNNDGDKDDEENYLKLLEDPEMIAFKPKQKVLEISPEQLRAMSNQGEVDRAFLRDLNKDIDEKELDKEIKQLTAEFKKDKKSIQFAVESDPNFLYSLNDKRGIRSYDTISAIVGRGKPTKDGIYYLPYLQSGHIIALLVILLSTFVYYPGFPLTTIDDDLRNILQGGLSYTFGTNLVLAICAILTECKKRGVSKLFWGLKISLLGGLAYNELQTCLPVLPEFKDKPGELGGSYDEDDDKKKEADPKRIKKLEKRAQNFRKSR